VILLTDGKPELSSTSSAAQRTAYVADLRALVERFRERGCPIFTIALSNTATDADPDIQTVYRNLWQEIAARTPPAEYHEARAAADLLHIYHAAVARLAGAQANAPIIEAAVDEHTTRTLVVEDGLAQVTLVVLRSDPALEVRLLRPGGAPARPHDPDVRRTGEPGTTREEVWTITDPRPGRWRLDLRGNGTVVVWQDTVSRRDSHPPAYAIDMAALPTYVPAGRPLDMAGISVRQVSTGRPVTGVGLRVVAELRRAGFAEATLLARDDGQTCDIEAGDGDYCATLPDPPPGACVLLMRGLLDGHEVARRQVAFEAIPLPALEVLSPRPGSSLEPSAPISVEVRVWAGERPLGEKELAAQGTLTASLRSAGLDAAVPLAEAGGIFAGSFVAPDSPGPLTLTVRLRGHTAEGLPFEDAARASLAVAAPDVQEGAGRSGPGWILPLAGLVGLAALGSVGGLLMRQRRGRVTLDGGLRVLEAPPGQPTGAVLDLPAASSVVLGGTGKGAVPLHEASSRVILRAGRAPEGDVETWIAPLAGEDDSAVALNGRPLDRARRLGDGDVLTLGTYRLRYESLRQASAQRARRRPRRRMDVMGGMR
jgi:hypothetical protein